MVNSVEMLERARLFNVNPLVGTLDDFVSQSAAQELTAALAPITLQSAELAGRAGAHVAEYRTAKNYKIPPEAIPQIDVLTQRIAALFRLEPSLCEHPEYIVYEQGGAFKRHFDGALSGAMPSLSSDPEAQSQRVFTGVLYLNDGFSGGTTVFPRLKVELTPKSGRLAFWQNTKPANPKAHPESMHEGRPVTAGHKHILSFWFRDRPWHAVNGA